MTQVSNPSCSEPLVSLLPEEVRSAYDYLPAQLAGNIAGVGLILMIFWGSMPVWTMLSWVSAYAVMWLGRLWLLRRFRQATPLSLVDWQRWRQLWNIGTLASGALWGATAWIFYQRGVHAQQTALIITVYTFCIAAVPALAIQPRVYMAFAALCFVPMALRVATSGTPDSYRLAGILLVIFLLSTLLARAYRQTLQRVLELKLQADHLLMQLRVEKVAADRARQEAELANRAKTQFFTAASHDLRQPLHAMGLFAEALRQKNHDVEVAHLVNSINESVDVLEGLFSELLDITRIDSGGVEVHPQHFQLSDLYRKLRLHFEPAAFEKGLALRFRGGNHVVYADPLLVERILRNLVSNGIRYTNDGGVLIGCRPRGDKLQVQVWDTGCGITPEQQPLVFEEFYQATCGSRPRPNQRTGLGLGLAIVKRLAGLMGAPVTLRSQPGQGSVFSLELPMGKRLQQALPSALSEESRRMTLQNYHVVVVEDEPSVLSGLEALLHGWGANIQAFDSVAACKVWVQHAPESTPRPHLLIVDYRLDAGLTGVDAIALVRSRFGAEVPAIVVTGSTMSSLDAEAQQKNFHLLIKPVVPNKLRAMIAFKLGLKAS